MFLGIDVGGTNTDAVLIHKNEVLKSAKEPTNHDNLVESIETVLSRILINEDINHITTINLSTTLCTNAIVEGKTEDIGTLVSAGPGIHPDNFQIGRQFKTIHGSIDHRGNEILNIDQDKLSNHIDKFTQKGINVFAVVGKFSTRNPIHENLIAKELMSRADFVTLGHQLSGHLNFPRRVATAYFNSATWRIYNEFADAIEKSLQRKKIACPVHILKADGGTIPMSVSRKLPVHTIHSGPAASVMGCLAVNEIDEDSIIMDIGGTTTDLALFAAGTPLLEKDGITINKKPTLIRAIKTKSIGIGGDSVIKVEKDKVQVGPERFGPAMAIGGDLPTLMDAFNTKGINCFGSVDRSKMGLMELSKKYGMTAPILADLVINYSILKIKHAVDSMIEEVNMKPVYTIHEMLYGHDIQPRTIYLMGGPSEAFADVLSTVFNMNVVVSKYHPVVNAIGAALTRTTMELELLADTEKGLRSIPSLNVFDKIGSNYNLEMAKKDIKAILLNYLNSIGAGKSDDFVEIMEAESFNMVKGFYTTGKNIRVKCQIKPGLVSKIGDNPEC